jgi:hypothetical protein
MNWSISLHDGYLERFSTSNPDRTVTLSVRVDYLADNEEAGDGSRFDLRFNGVQAVHVTEWEERTPLDEETPSAFDERMLQGRIVSIAADDFVASGMRITEAAVSTLVASELLWPLPTFAAATTLVNLFTLNTDSSEWEDAGDRALAIVFDNVDILRGGSRMTEQEFLQLGESSWRKLLNS